MSESDNTLTVDEEIEQLYAEAEGKPVETEDDAATETEDSSGSENPEDESGSDTTSTDEVDAGTETEATNTDKPDDSGLELSDKQTDEPEVKAPSRSDKKDKALTRSWDNADKRHKDADSRVSDLDAREARILVNEKRLEQLAAPAPNDPHPQHAPESIADAIGESLDEGDLDMARNMVKSLAAKASANKAAQGGPDSPEFQQAWGHVRDQVIVANPDLSDAKSDLFKGASGVLSGEFKALLHSHPLGVAASVAVAKLQSAAESVPALTKQIERLKTENAELKSSTQLESTGTTRRGAPGRSSKSQTPDEEVASLYEDARRLG